MSGKVSLTLVDIYEKGKQRKYLKTLGKSYLMPITFFQKVKTLSIMSQMRKWRMQKTDNNGIIIPIPNVHKVQNKTFHCIFFLFADVSASITYKCYVFSETIGCFHGLHFFLKSTFNSCL